MTRSDPDVGKGQSSGMEEGAADQGMPRTGSWVRENGAWPGAGVGTDGLWGRRDLQDRQSPARGWCRHGGAPVAVHNQPSLERGCPFPAGPGSRTPQPGTSVLLPPRPPATCLAGPGLDQAHPPLLCASGYSLLEASEHLRLSFSLSIWPEQPTSPSWAPPCSELICKVDGVRTPHSRGGSGL